MTHTITRTAREGEMRRLVRRGALILAEYDWRESGVPGLRERGREWILQLPDPPVARSVSAVPQHAA